MGQGPSLILYFRLQFSVVFNRNGISPGLILLRLNVLFDPLDSFLEVTDSSSGRISEPLVGVDGISVGGDGGPVGFDGLQKPIVPTGEHGLR